MKKNLFLIVYLLIQITLYFVSVFIDIDISLKYLYYSFVLLNFLFALYLLFSYKTKDAILMNIALLFTLISDTFLVLIGDYKTIAMVSFSIVQLCYYLRLLSFRINLTNNNKITINSYDFVRGILLVFSYIMVGIILKDKFDFLITFVVFYFVMLVMNFVESIKYKQRSKLFMIGLLLFICCDIFIGLGNS